MIHRILAGVILGVVVLAAAAIVQKAGDGLHWPEPQAVGAASR
ncbi:hypothetical protein Pan44_29420 [Caulifigura coniformis]|uniref:Uncharacterized protein n=1 Tax=Caulifigura coniformis TaxID=2527983 RepID=A0A517SFJ7_9PLAN|nr:hypothetical protein [Caulifigura coniformis]QDT54903.1 hypothetical protein Pan44_29420 [Caulifigura coniformis]